MAIEDVAGSKNPGRACESAGSQGLVLHAGSPGGIAYVATVDDVLADLDRQMRVLHTAREESAAVPEGNKEGGEAQRGLGRSYR